LNPADVVARHHKHEAVSAAVSPDATIKSGKIHNRLHNLSQKRERASKQAASRRRKQVMPALFAHRAFS
jgi:hypothetical protein